MLPTGDTPLYLRANRYPMEAPAAFWWPARRIVSRYLSVARIGTAVAICVAGACSGALFFGQLTDRFGRKKLFMITPGVYVVFHGVLVRAVVLLPGALLHRCRHRWRVGGDQLGHR
jgi:MFS family permease